MKRRWVVAAALVCLFARPGLGAVVGKDVFPVPPPPLSEMGSGEESMGTSGEGEQTGMGNEAPPEKPDLATVAALVQKGGCAGCHTIAGIEGALGDLGPEWCTVARKYQADEIDLDYIRQAIVDPNAVVAEGFPANIMPQNFGDLFTPDEIDALVAFIATMDCP